MIETLFQQHEQTRAISEGDEGEEQKFIVGSGIVYNEWSPVYWGFRERVMPGAATERLELDDIRASFNHSDDILLGRNNGTLELTETDLSVDYRILVDEFDADSINTYRKIQSKKVTGSSFTFRIGDEELEYVEMDDGTTLIQRTIHTLKELREMGPVSYPFYPTTDSQARTIPTREELSRICKHHGLNLPDANIKADKEAAIRFQRQIEMEQIEINKRSLELCQMK